MHLQEQRVHIFATGIVLITILLRPQCAESLCSEQAGPASAAPGFTDGIWNMRSIRSWNHGEGPCVLLWKAFAWETITLFVKILFKNILVLISGMKEEKGEIEASSMREYH